MSGRLNWVKPKKISFMKSPIFSLILFLLCHANAFAQKPSKAKLVVGIVVDQMRWDYLYRYQNRYGSSGFNRLLKEGFNCQNTYLNYVPSYTAPGHASIYSGAVPAIHGIVGNDWIENNSQQYCASDNMVQSIGGSTKAGQMSPHAMKTTTIGDELRLATNFRSRVFGIALKDRGAIFPAGHSANAAFWFDDSTGNFISSSYYSQYLPKWLQHFNAQRWADTLSQNNWETLYPIASYTESIADNNEYEYLRKGETSPTFPHKNSPNNYKQIRSLPAGNTLTFQLAKSLINAEELGLRNETDMLCISLSASDYIGHAYAPNSAEVEDMYLRLDKDIASFLRYLDYTIGEGNYTIFLSADHGAAHNAPFLVDHKIPSGNLAENDLERELKALMKKTFGADSVIRAVMNYQIVLDEPFIEKKKLNRGNIKNALTKYCQKTKGIAQVIDLENMGQNNIPGFLKEVIANGYYASRCGAIGIIYQPAWYSDGKKGTTHGTWNPYDTHIPLLWYGWGIPQGETFGRVEATDIAATLAALLHIQAPNGCIGNVIEMKK
jgi:predicted AlkP superfamily pyrophosphatase or phosphodiesterase